MTKSSLNVIVNHINDAVILRTEDGNISYCNHLGLSYIKSVSDGIFNSESSLKKFFENIGSMDLLLQRVFGNLEMEE